MLLCICRYEELNIHSLSTVHRYDQSVPHFLLNRPKKFVKHCLHRMPPFVEVDEACIKVVSDGVYTVSSRDSDRTYEVRLHSVADPDSPSCQCEDWRKHPMPCKHMLAVVTHAPNCTWENLPLKYRSFPLFCLDPDILQQSSNTGIESCTSVTPDPASVMSCNNGTTNAIDTSSNANLSSINDIAGNCIADSSDNVHVVNICNTNTAADVCTTLANEPADVACEPSGTTSTTETPKEESLTVLQRKVRNILHNLINYSYGICDRTVLTSSIVQLKQTEAKFSESIPVAVGTRLPVRTRTDKRTVTRLTGLFYRQRALRAAKLRKKTRLRNRRIPNVTKESNVIGKYSK